MDDENENGVSVDNEDNNNNNNDEINRVVPPIIQNSPPHPPIERGSSSKSVPIFNDSGDGNASNSKHSMYAEPMDVDPPSIIRVACRNVTSKRAKGTIGVRIIVAARGASSSMIGEGGMDDNVLVETNANQNTSTEMNRTGSGAVVTGDGTNIAIDAKVVHHFHRTAGMTSSEQGGTLVDVSSSARPPRPQCPLLLTTVVSLEVEPIRRSMEVDRISIQTKAAIIGGRLKQHMPEIEPF